MRSQHRPTPHGEHSPRTGVTCCHGRRGRHRLRIIGLAGWRARGRQADRSTCRCRPPAHALLLARIAISGGAVAFAFTWLLDMRDPCRQYVTPLLDHRAAPSPPRFPAAAAVVFCLLPHGNLGLEWRRFSLFPLEMWHPSASSRSQGAPRLLEMGRLHFRTRAASEVELPMRRPASLEHIRRRGLVVLIAPRRSSSHDAIPSGLGAYLSEAVDQERYTWPAGHWRRWYSSS